MKFNNLKGPGTRIPSLHSFAGALFAGGMLLLAGAAPAQNIYVANGNDTVGEYGMDGSVVNAALISGLDDPGSIAISSVPEPSAGALAGLGATSLWFWLWRRRK